MLQIHLQSTQNPLENTPHRVLRRNLPELLEQVARLLVPTTYSIHPYLPEERRPTSKRHLTYENSSPRQTLYYSCAFNVQ